MIRYIKVFSLVLMLSIVSCAGKRGFISVDDQSPQVSFLEQRAVEISPSSIALVDIEQVIASYQRLLNRGDAKIRLEALHQLANLTMRLAEIKLNQATDSLPQQSSALEEASFDKAIVYYQTILSEFPDYPQQSKVKYQLARAYSLNANPVKSLQLLDNIAQIHQSAEPYLETQFRRGESYFVQANYAIAQQAYSEVLNSQNNQEFFEKALYKRGWSLFKQNKFDLALDDFFLLFEALQPNTSQLENSKLSSSMQQKLLDDTLRVISLSFYNQRGVESIMQYFATHKQKDYANVIYQSLANLFIEQERYQDAADTYMAYIQAHPLSLTSPDFHTQAIEIYQKGGFPSLILPAKEKFVRNYGRGSEFWRIHLDKQSRINKLESQILTREALERRAIDSNSLDRAILDQEKIDQLDLEKHNEIIGLLKNHLIDISTFYHAQAQSSKKLKDYRVTANWYYELLAINQDNSSRKKTTLGDIRDKNEKPGDEFDSKYRFLLAEVLFEAEQFQQAAIEFETVAYHNRTNQFARDAGYRALLCYQSLQSEGKNGKDQTNHKNILLASIQSGLMFAKTFHTDEKRAEILAAAAENQLQIADISGAISTSKIILEPQSKADAKQTLRAQIIVANGYFDLMQFSQARLAFDQLIVSKQITAKQRSEFRQRRVEAIYQLAEKAQTENQSQQAVDLYLSIARLEPKLNIATKAHFDAATLLLKMEQWNTASGLLESFRQKYPRHELTETIAEKLALSYEKQQQWQSAAIEYQKLVLKQKDPEIIREFYWHIAELYLKAENKLAAIKAFKKYVWDYPMPYLLAQEGRQHLVDLYVAVKDQSKAHFWRQKIVNFYTEQKSANNARTTTIAAKAQYEISEEYFDVFKKIKLKLPLDKSLKKKRQAMKQALNAYNQLASYQVTQYTTASTHKVARIYQILSDDLMSSQRPNGLNQEEQEEYGYLLEDQALPFEDKAIEFFEVNAKRTASNIYDESVRLSMHSLKKLKPVQYNKNEKLEALSDVSF